MAGLHVEVFTEMHKNPLKSDVLKGGDAYHDAKCDCIVGIGGGVVVVVIVGCGGDCVFFVTCCNP